RDAQDAMVQACPPDIPCHASGRRARRHLRQAHLPRKPGVRAVSGAPDRRPRRPGLSLSGGNTSFVVCLRPDGSEKSSGSIVYAAANATANADGVVASANFHFAHKVALYNRNWESV